MTKIHPTAVVHADAQLGDGCVVGPHAVIEAGVVLGEGCEIGAFSMVHSGVTMGSGNVVSEHVVLGGPPQDLGFDSSCASGVEIGANNRFREFFTVHRSTREGGLTRIGSNCFFMFSSHVAHDCAVEDDVVIAGYTALAGHVQVGQRAFISGHVLVHQHVRIGRLSMIAGLVPVERDVLPFALLGRNPAVLYGLNLVGLKRAGIKGSRYQVLREVFRACKDGVAAEDLPGDSEEVAHLKQWLIEPSVRGLCPFSRPGERRRAV